MKPLLLIAHPGHELRIFEWVRRVRPHVVMLTHGDGSIGQPRLEDSEHLLHQIGVRVRTDWLQPVSDGAVYQALLDTDVSLIDGWLARLTHAAQREPFDCIVADEAEGYNPSHDLCRVLANRLQHRLQQAGSTVRALEFPLIEHPCDPARSARAEIDITLSPQELDTKLALMKSYAERCSPVLAQELQTMLDRFGEQAFARECIYEASVTPYEQGQLPVTAPYFETRGEERMKAGIYQHVIRARHLLEQVQALNAQDTKAPAP